MQLDVAGRRLVQPGDQVEQRRLAAARRAEQADELAGLDVQVDAAQRGRPPRRRGRTSWRRRAASSGGASGCGLPRASDGRGHLSVTPEPRRVRRRPPSACRRPVSTSLSGVRSTMPVRFGLLLGDAGVTPSLASCGNVAASGSSVRRQLGPGTVEHGVRSDEFGQLLDRVVRRRSWPASGRRWRVDRLRSAAQSARRVRVLLQELGPDDEHGGRELAVRPQVLLVDEHRRRPRRPGGSSTARAASRRRLAGLEHVEGARVVDVRDVTAPGPSPLVRFFSLSHFLQRDVLRVAELRGGDDLALEVSGVVMSGETTSCAPPEVAPAISRTASPLLFAKALIAGPEPMKPASSEPPSSADDLVGARVEGLGGELRVAELLLE